MGPSGEKILAQTRLRQEVACLVRPLEVQLPKEPNRLKVLAQAKLRWEEACSARSSKCQLTRRTQPTESLSKTQARIGGSALGLITQALVIQRLKSPKFAILYMVISSTSSPLGYLDFCSIYLYERWLLMGISSSRSTASNVLILSLGSLL